MLRLVLSLILSYSAVTNGHNMQRHLLGDVNNPKTVARKVVKSGVKMNEYTPVCIDLTIDKKKTTPNFAVYSFESEFYLVYFATADEDCTKPAKGCIRLSGNINSAKFEDGDVDGIHLKLYDTSFEPTREWHLSADSDDVEETVFMQAVYLLWKNKENVYLSLAKQALEAVEITGNQANRDDQLGSAKMRIINVFTEEWELRKFEVWRADKRGEFDYLVYYHADVSIGAQRCIKLSEVRGITVIPQKESIVLILFDAAVGVATVGDVMLQLEIPKSRWFKNRWLSEKNKAAKFMSKVAAKMSKVALRQRQSLQQLL